MLDKPITKIKIISDGTAHGTRVETEDGKVIQGIKSINWQCKPNQFCTATLELLDVPVEVVAFDIILPQLEKKE